MHRRLKAETTRPPSARLREQRRRFTAFHHRYNEERPHGALSNATPATSCRPKRRETVTHVPGLAVT
jgi:putative transposase